MGEGVGPVTSEAQILSICSRWGFNLSRGVSPAVGLFTTWASDTAPWDGGRLPWPGRLGQVVKRDRWTYLPMFAQRGTVSGVT